MQFAFVSNKWGWGWGFKPDTSIAQANVHTNSTERLDKKL